MDELSPQTILRKKATAILEYLCAQQAHTMWLYVCKVKALETTFVHFSQKYK